MALYILRKYQKIQALVIYRGICQDTITSNKVLIPRVDLEAPKDDIVNKILQASRSGGPGLFYLFNHGIDQSIFENAINESNKFYSQPLQQKLDISFSGYAGSPFDKSSKGYTYPGFEGSYAKDGASDVRPKTEDASVQKNLREALVFRYPELKENDRAYLQDYTRFRNHLNGSVDPIEDVNIVGSAAKCFFANNQWPKEGDLPNFRSSIEAYFNQMKRLATNMFDLFLHALRTELNVPEDHHFFHYDTPMSTFNLAHYPPSENKGFGISDHTDWELSLIHI